MSQKINVTNETVKKQTELINQVATINSTELANTKKRTACGFKTPEGISREAVLGFNLSIFLSR